MNGFEKRREIKKNNIRKAALELFAQFGFDKVTINEIAAHANVSPVSIYNFFGSKDNLIEEVIIDLINMNIKIFKEKFNEDLSFKEIISFIFLTKKDLITKGYYNLITSANISNNVKKHLEYMTTESKSMFLELIQKGKNEGIINKNLSHESILIYIDIFQEYFLNNEVSTKKIISNMSLFEEINNMFWKGLE